MKKSHFFQRTAYLRYKLGLNIPTGNLVWIQDPYRFSKYTDIRINNKVLMHFLEVGERVEADEDEGYHGHADKNQMPRKSHESSGEVGDAGEGEGMA